MTEKSANQDWLHIQQQFWETWLSLNRQVLERSAQQLTDCSWTETLEVWWQILAPVIPADRLELLKKFVDQSKHYLYLNEQFIKTFQPLFTQQLDSDSWQRLWEDSFAQLQTHFIEQLKAKNIPLNWALPLQDMPLLTLLELFRNLNVEGSAPADMQAYRERFLAGTPVHALQKWQQRYQQHWQLGIAYQHAQKEYNLLLGKVAEQALDLLKQKLEQRFEAGQAIEHLYQLYELWIAASEHAYAQMVNTPEYSQAYAELINKLMAFKQHERQIIEALMTHFNLPTRKELDATNARIQQLRREMRALPVEDHDSSIAELQQTIEQLKREIETLKKAQTPKRRKTTRRSQASS